MLRLFYAVKPLIPRRLQILLRRIRARRILDRLEGAVLWDDGLHDAAFPWPDGARAAVLVTHDVELAGGQERIPALVEIEERLGIRSCWNFVTDRYPVDTGLIAQLQSLGHEVGVHGVKHDGKLFSSPEEFHRRLTRVVQIAKEWNADGFRSPALLHDLDLLASLPFGWDSSVPAWDPFQPMSGGVETYRPFMLNRHCVELPVTCWQDFTLFEELDIDAMAVWRRQINGIADAGGLINIIIHPDYLTDSKRIGIYEQLLEFICGYDGLWITTPCELADWARPILARESEA